MPSMPHRSSFHAICDFLTLSISWTQVKPDDRTKGPSISLSRRLHAQPRSRHSPCGEHIRKYHAAIIPSQRRYSLLENSVTQFPPINRATDSKITAYKMGNTYKRINTLTGPGFAAACSLGNPECGALVLPCEWRLCSKQRTGMV